VSVLISQQDHFRRRGLWLGPISLRTSTLFSDPISNMAIPVHSRRVFQYLCVRGEDSTVPGQRPGESESFGLFFFKQPEAFRVTMAFVVAVRLTYLGNAPTSNQIHVQHDIPLPLDVPLMAFCGGAALLFWLARSATRYCHWPTL
jgi:hypothetical protein